MIKDWFSQAACRDGDPDDLLVWNIEGAKKICRGCPVRWDCLADALDNRIEVGTWGGMTERERQVLLRRHPMISSWRTLFEEALRAESTTKTVTATKDFETELAAIRELMVRNELTAFYNEERLLLVRFLIRFGASEQDAFDAVQDAFLEACRCWERIHTPRAWLRRVALRKLKRRPEVPLSEQLDVRDPRLSGIQIKEETRHVLDALRQLPKTQRIVIAWTLDGFKPAEIAAELDMTSEAVRQALARARQNLKRLLLPDGGKSL